MDSPLSAISPSKVNALGSKIPTPMNLTPSKSPLKSQTGNINKTPILVRSNSDEDEINWDEGPSSPFLSELVEDKENLHGMFSRSTSSIAPTEVIPRDQDDIGVEQTPRPLPRTPFKIAEDDTCTFHTSKSTISTSRAPSPSKPNISRSSTQDSITVVSESSHESRSSHRVVSYGTDIGDITMNEEQNIDDTCFSTFSEVPNTDMTAFANLGQRSPTKQMLFDQTPRSHAFNTPGTARTRLAARSPSPTPTPRRHMANLPQYQDSSDTTNLLLDFTQQFEVNSIQQRQRSPARRSPTKLSTEPNLLLHLQNQRSPVKGGFATPRAAGKNNILNLLDFELPPAPTPRSIPSITVREMESLKSKYSSEISSLRATLSGREAEVESLKRAVGDAERRVGEAMESSREERSKREFVEKEKEEWQRRGRDFEEILRKVKEEVTENEKERTELMNRVEDSEERARDAELRASDAEARAIEAATKIVDTGCTAGDDQKGPLFTAEQVQKQIDEKVHSLSTELHTIYKKKHVTKVAGLKKGFEAKTKEKTTELQERIEDLEKRNEELQSRFDATLSGVLPSDLASRLTAADAEAEQRETDLKQLEEQYALIESQKAALAGREEEIRTARAEFAAVMKELERERVEKGELVAAVDEMLLLQSDISTVSPEAGSAVEDFKKSIGAASTTGARPSGLRAPGGFGFGGGSKIGAPAMSRSMSGGKSKMMSNIERMAGGRSMD